MSVTFPEDSGPPASPLASAGERQVRCRACRQRRPSPRRRGGLHPQPGPGRPRALWSRQAVADGRLDAVVLNSGGANACTGSEGFLDTHRTAEEAAMLLGVSAGDVAVCSTGLIGERLPMDKLLAGLANAVAELSPHGGDEAARAIMTTDTVPKTAHFQASGWRVGGMAKGAGMLAPGLATMFVVLTTDAVVEPGDHLRARPAGRGRAHLRPDRLRRVHVHQ